MTIERKIEGIYDAPGSHWVGDGFRVMGYFSKHRELVRKLSPYLLLDYGAPHLYPPTENSRRGVGPHPHRGFETVTVAFQGAVAHHDSTGSGGVIGPGDVQWMTAGSGILHREYHDESFARRGGPMQMAQIWVNLPKAHKMHAPRYQAITAGDIAEAKIDGGVVRVIAGEYRGVRGPASTFTPIKLFDTRLEAGGHVDFEFPAHENTAFLIMNGPVTINGGRVAQTNDLVVFANEGERVTVEAKEPAQFLVLNGEPIDEPVVQYGPFVMNSEREIQQAIRDFQTGKFGQLEE